jgi:hypothetical protein
MPIEATFVLSLWVPPFAGEDSVRRTTNKTLLRSLTHAVQERVCAQLDFVVHQEPGECIGPDNRCLS